jgi:hypothetical protein
MLPIARTLVRPMASTSGAAARLNAVSRHLSVSARAQAGATMEEQTKAGKRVERLTVFGAGLMGQRLVYIELKLTCLGAGIAQVGAQNGLKVLLLAVTRTELARSCCLTSRTKPWSEWNFKLLRAKRQKRNQHHHKVTYPYRKEDPPE